MLNKFIRSALILTIITFTGCVTVLGGPSEMGVSTDRRDTENVLIDQALEIKIKKLSDKIPELTTSRIQIHSFNGHVLLLGQTATQDNIHLLSQKISEIEGVKKIYNEISIGPTIGFWEWSTDRIIDSKIKSSMVVTKGVNPLRIKVFTEKKVVYLVGIVKDLEEETAVDIASHTSGVEKVVKIFERL